MKPKLTKEQISSWDAKERSKLCKRNEGRPVGRYATRQPCVTAVVENPSICNSPQEQQEMDLAQQVKAQAEQSYAAAQGAQPKASSVPQHTAAAAAQADWRSPSAEAMPCPYSKQGKPCPFKA